MPNFKMFRARLQMRSTTFKGLILNSRVAARRGAARWVEIFGNFYKIACMVDLSVFLFYYFFIFKSQAAGSLYSTRSRMTAVCTSCC